MTTAQFHTEVFYQYLYPVTKGNKLINAHTDTHKSCTLALFCQYSTVFGITQRPS